MASYSSGPIGCRDTPQVNMSVLVAVGDDVSVGRTRIKLGSSKGPWQTSRPNRGMVNFRLVLDGAETRVKPASIEFELLDRRGDRVTIHRNDKAGGPDTGKSGQVDIYNCVDFDKLLARMMKSIARREKRPPMTRPGPRTVWA